MVIVRTISPLGMGVWEADTTAGDLPVGRSVGGRSVTAAKNGMVAASQSLAVQAGVEILKAGGTALDAAIAVNACLGVMEPTSCGIGGDIFALIWDPKTKRLFGLNGSGRAPFAYTPDLVVPTTKAGTIHPHSTAAWTVPGCVDGWFALHGKFGKLGMSRVLASAIQYAEEGFPLSPVIASEWAGSVKVFAEKPGFREVFMPNGRAPKAGEMFKNPSLGASYRLLAEKGRDAFYRGPITDAIVAFSKRHHGWFSLEDFATHHSTWDEPISTEYRGYTVWELPPNGQGLAALQMLNMLEGFDLKAMGRSSPDFWHVMTEVKKLAFADRARYYADPAFHSVLVAQLLSKEYAKDRAGLVSMTLAALQDPPGDPEALNRKETTLICTADREGMMVVLIQSNYTGFGSGYTIAEWGFGLQNRGALFSLKPGHPNRIEAGKRPFHTIIPAFLGKNGIPLMAFGVMGGDMQPQGHVQIVVNLVDFGMNLQQAGDAPRIYHRGSSEPTGTTMTDGGLLHLEEGVSKEVIEELTRRGHRIQFALPGAYGGYQGIWRDPETGVYFGASESRKDGAAMGY